MTAHRQELSSSMLQSAESLLGCYTQLAEAQQHLLGPLLKGAKPRQWAHYPDDDVIDADTGFQYFYHSHSPDDRPDLVEHGHFHLFARLDASRRVIDVAGETQFLSRLRAAPAPDGKTASLLCIGLDPKGVPRSLFTVNRWVTGDHLLSADATLALLREFRITAGETALINTWLAAMIGLFWPQIVELLHQRDRKLGALAVVRPDGGDLLDDASIELLSSVQIDIDHQIQTVVART